MTDNELDQTWQLYHRYFDLAEAGKVPKLTCPTDGNQLFRIMHDQAVGLICYWCGNIIKPGLIMNNNVREALDARAN